MHLTALLTAVLTVKNTAVHCACLILSASLWRGPAFLKSSQINMVINREQEERHGSLKTTRLHPSPIKM